MIRFVCKDGLGSSTTLLDAETGADISKILFVRYGVKIEIGEMVKAECELEMIEADIVAGITTFLMKHPISRQHKPVAAIEFRDGIRIVFAEDGTPSVAEHS